MDECSFDINPDLQRDALTAQFRASRRMHAANFFPAPTAEAINRDLIDLVSYQTYVVANGQQMGTEPGEASILTEQEEREMLEVAQDGARHGFASYFEANHLLLDEDGSPESGEPSTYRRCVEFFYSSEFLAFVRQITGIDSLNRVRLHATRFRGGHFVLFNGGTFSSDPTGKRRVHFELNLTQQWRPEWGGMFEVRGREGHEIEAVMPCFNSLDLIGFPRGYWISQVTPFAHAYRYAVAGSVYID